MTTFAQFSFVCMIIIGFGLTHFWPISSATMNVVSARRWFLGFLVLAVSFLPLALFTYEFVRPSGG